MNLLIHHEWTAPLGWSAPLWGLVTIGAYFHFWLAAKRDKGQWDKGQWTK